MTAGTPAADNGDSEATRTTASGVESLTPQTQETIATMMTAMRTAAPDPQNLPVRPENIPAALTALDRWVCWRFRRRDGRLRKVPVHPRTGRTASVTDPSDWSSFEDAVARLGRPNPPDGIGFVFAADGLVGVDLDGCRNPDTGVLDPWAADMVETLSTYAEVSPSGTGVKVVAHGRLPVGGKRRENVEVYADGRFFTLTGRRLPGAPPGVADRQAELDVVYRRVAGGAALPVAGPSVVGVGAVAERDDEAVADHIAQGEAGGVFARLWAGDTSGYTSASEADLALCGAVARLVGPDPGRVEDVFGMSALAAREKWQTRADYRERTAGTAVAGLGNRTTSPRTSQDCSGDTQACARPHTRGELLPAKLDEAVLAAEHLVITQGKDANAFRAVFDLARRLKAFADQPHPLRDAVRTYCEKAGRDYDEVWLMLLDAWPRVRMAEGDGNWDWACRMARENPIVCRPENGEKYELAASLAHYLSLLNDPFPFGGEKVGQFLGVSKRTGTTVVNLLVRDGVIALAAEADHAAKKAREFRFVGGCPSDIIPA